MSLTKVNADKFMFFPEFMLALMRAIEQHQTVLTFERTKACHDGLDVEFEVCIKKLNGKAMPRITQRMLQQAKKETK